MNSDLGERIVVDAPIESKPEEVSAPVEAPKE